MDTLSYNTLKNLYKIEHKLLIWEDENQWLTTWKREKYIY